MVKAYIPDSGDIVWLNFSPQAGHEQAGHRPGVVLSPKGYNAATNRMIICPMTTKVKGYPFEVAITEQSVPSVVLADQVKSLDWKARGVQYKGKAQPSEIEQIRKLISKLIGM